MKKRGFTLSELLISMGVIGVIAAITLPALSNKVPDKNKVEVLRVHDMLLRAHVNMLEGVEAYVVPDNDNCDGLACGSAALYYNTLVREIENTTPVSGAANSYYLPNRTRITISVSMAGNNFGSVTIRPFDKEGCGNYNGSSCTRRANLFTFNIDNYGRLTPDNTDYLARAYIKNRITFNDKNKDYNDAQAFYNH